MCGIYGYIRHPDSRGAGNPVDVCLEGLSLLEYRGYDSAGIAGVVDGKIKSYKRSGKVAKLRTAFAKQPPSLDAAIAHTRWATHGSPNRTNAHPHLDETGSMAIVHNGIIENHDAVRRELTEKGISFRSDTDSEVIVQLIAYLRKEGEDLANTVRRALKRLVGSLAIAVVYVNDPRRIVVASRESSLVIGIDPERRVSYLSSDSGSLRGKALQLFRLQDEEIADVGEGTVVISDREGRAVSRRPERVTGTLKPVSKEGFEHFMLKEIYEQPATIRIAMKDRTDGDTGNAVFQELSGSRSALRRVNRILIVGCGTSWHAGSITALLMESFARIPTEARIASEFRYGNPLITKGTLVIALSQSGETADTIAALREAKKTGAHIIGISNNKDSTVARESHDFIDLYAGPEISVVSTKAFTSQLVVLALFVLLMARFRGVEEKEGRCFLEALSSLPEQVEEVLRNDKSIADLAKRHVACEHFFFLGRRYMFPTSLEAALKLKETGYVSANGYPAGEMKHGPLALVGPHLTAVGLCGNRQTVDKACANLAEVKARGGRVIAFAPEGIDGLRRITEEIIYMPEVIDTLASIPYSVAGQLFAYHVAGERGNEIDHPRNLAKSVTVE
ncbi:MAG: glutamine--fructose-6-phosphate transaminase (isomerizing) [Simkaniaceae bacterium]|nr:glutamine--fructose-6-phosphate transaminase (isomerizing) [Simkaniaceae bacterium]